MSGPVLSRLLAILMIAAALPACGFRLAGSASLPQHLATIYLVTGDFSDAQHAALRDRLERAGAELTAQPQDAVRLTVKLKSLPDRRLATGAGSGKSVERLTRQLEYRLQREDGSMLAPAKTLTQQKDIVLDDDNLLASSQEKVNVVRDLQQALFNQLIRQLARI